MTHERAASQLGCPVGTVRSRLARARARLHGQLARRGFITSTATLTASLATDAGAATVPPHLPMSLVKTAARVAAGTVSLRDECGVSVRVAALFEGVLNMLRVKQIVVSTAALAGIGIVSTLAGLSVFSASGQTGDNQARTPPVVARPLSQTSEKPAPETYVKTYYVGDLIIPPTLAMSPGSPVRPQDIRAARAALDMSPIIDLITSTVARETWTVVERQSGTMTSDGKRGVLSANAPSAKKVGVITPFYLSVSLIIRHTKEGHDEVANLLRRLRRLLDSRVHPEGVAGYDRDQKTAGLQVPPDAQNSNPPAPTPPPDRNARIRRLLDELRKEVEGLTKDQG
jgi:hypothetical protein